MSLRTHRTVALACALVCFSLAAAETTRAALGAVSVELVPASRALEERARSLGAVNANGVRAGRA